MQYFFNNIEKADGYRKFGGYSSGTTVREKHIIIFKNHIPKKVNIYCKIRGIVIELFCKIVSFWVLNLSGVLYMKKFDGVLICTDLDGTLLREDKTISRENIEAIEYFKGNGGLFTFITGRMPNFVYDIANLIKPNAPIGCVNGGGLYDCKNKKYLWTSVMPDEVLDLIECIDKKFPDVGIQTCTFGKTYFSKDNTTMKWFRRVTNAENFVCHYREVKEPIAKIIFGSDKDEEVLKIKETLEGHPLSDKFDFIRSEKVFYEILPKGISKGTSIEKLCEKLNIDINKTIAIGDYNNDIPMFRAAKFGIAVENACPEALAAADFITVSNEQNAVARVINDLEKGEYIGIL